MPRALIMMIVFLAAMFVAIAVAAGRAGRGPVAGLMLVLAAGLVVILIVRAMARRGSGGPRIRPAEAAARLGWSHREKGEKSFHHRFGDLPGIPRSGVVRHVMEGDLDGRGLTVFEHLYHVNTGQAVVPVFHTVYLSPAGAWPLVRVTKRRTMRRFLDRFGTRKGVQLEDETFNTACVTRTEDEDFAIALLGPEMQAFLATRPDIAWRIGHGYTAMIYGGRLRAERLESSLDRLRRFWELVPSELRDA